MFVGRCVVTVTSMTGFGRSKISVSGFEITVEIKAVNHKFFEFSSRVPRAYQFLDEKLKKRCGSKISRGKVEASVLIDDVSGSGTELCINRDYAEAYISALHSLAKEYRIRDDIKVSSLVNNPDIFVLKKKNIDEQLITDSVLSAAGEALEHFVEMRAKEGERLAADVENRADEILKKVEFIESRSPQTVREYRARLEQKIKELIGDVSVDEQRLITETAIFADKIAVDEETVRLRSHIASLHGLFESGGVIGRKLDFLVQEMNRETNTIGSKCQDIEITKTVVDIKAEIEKIREQIQNIE